MKAMLTPRKVSISINQAKEDKLVELVQGMTDSEMNLALKDGRNYQRAAGTTYKSELFGVGWSLTEDAKYIMKSVEMPLMFETAHESGGVPDVGTPSDEEIVSAVDDLINKFHIAPADLAKIINNGLYLSFNAVNKPKSQTLTLAGLTSLFAKAQSDEGTRKPELWTEYASAVQGSDKGLAWLKAWFGKNS